MSQVIEVRFINPDTAEAIGDEFASADSHRQAVELALAGWSGGAGVLLGMEQTEDTQGVWTGIPGGNGCWKYVYHITLEGEDGVGERHAFAVLFATYKEKEG